MRTRRPKIRGGVCRGLRGLPGALAAAAALAALPAGAAGAEPQQLLYSTEGNRLRRFDVDTLEDPAIREDVLIPSANDGEQGGTVPASRARDVNGMICLLPDGSGRFVLGEDTGQPHPRPGWGVFTRGGVQVGKLTPTSFVTEPDNAEPFGCVFDSQGILFTTELGGVRQGNGQLIQWFPPYDVFPGPAGAYPETDAVSTSFCKIAVDIDTATGIAIDEQDRIYVASPSASVVHRFAGAFPTSPDAAGGCGRSDALGSPLVDAGRITPEIFISDPRAAFPSGIARAPNGNWYVSSVLLGTIAEFDPDGVFVRTIMEPDEPPLVFPKSTGSPQSLTVDREGSIYYADLDLCCDFFGPEPGPDGKVRRVRFDENGDPLPPGIVRAGLAFPDGVALLPGDLSLWPTYGGSPERKFFNREESILGPANVGDLRVRWRFPTQSIVTGSPTAALVEVAGEGRIEVVYFLSWDLNVYALRLSDGSELWHFETEDQPGASFPATASVDVSEIGGQPRVFVGQGETFYSLDAATGQEIWRFTAGTGCGGADPPGLCGFKGERNEIESSAVVHDGLVFFGMDVNDVETGKGGFYALDAGDGRLRWFFDLESGFTCRPFETDEVRRFDGYHSEAELGLEPGFFASREGCDFDRTPTGCGNVWSSAALDAERGLLYVASSNCDTDLDPGTSIPPPPMPFYDEAVFALDLAGNPVWRWRPREVDNDDLAFGAPPNLFSIQTLRGERDVVGVGNKDGTYYVLDRDGVNALNRAPAEDPNPLAFPYWVRNVVPGGDIGGILAAAAVDEPARRIYFSTAPGRSGVNDPPGPAQTPTVHALDMDTGAVVWDNGAETPPPFASFAPASAIPGLAFFGHVPFAFLRIHETTNDSGARLANLFLDIFGLTSAPAVVQGTVLVGNGIGVRTDTGSGPPVVSLVPSPLTAFCVPGTLDCWPCRDGFNNDDGDDETDFPEDAECTSETDLSEENDCEDLLDNDGDGLRDFPDDPDCASATGVTEVPEPGGVLLGAVALAAVRFLARRSRTLG
jgi:outer membrane protein assembly factor BamB